MYERERCDMVSQLVAFGYLHDKRVIATMKNVPRHLFVPKEAEKYAYEDRPLPVGEEQTISAPHIVAIMCDALELKEGHKVLEVGAGTGYHACIISEIVKCTVFAIERLEILAKKAEENIRNAGCGRVKIILGDGSKGYESEAPYDRILVTAGAPDIPKPLIAQLKPGGKLLIPIGGKYSQELILAEKISENKIEKKSLCSCAFVPLIGEYGWL